MTLRDLAGRSDRRLDLEIRTATLQMQARQAWIAHARAYRWTLWMRLSWSWPVSESTAYRHLDRWATRLRHRFRGAALLVGIHIGQGRIHAHALLYLPRCGAPHGPGGRPGWARWLATRYHEILWGHGKLWLDRYRPGRGARQHGAPEYLTTQPETVATYGCPMPYQPRRKR